MGRPPKLMVSVSRRNRFGRHGDDDIHRRTNDHITSDRRGGRWVQRKPVGRRLASSPGALDARKPTPWTNEQIALLGHAAAVAASLLLALIALLGASYATRLSNLDFNSTLYCQKAS